MKRLPSCLRSLLAAAALLAAHAIGSPARADETIDPALADSWKFVQQTMPGASYDLLKGACAEGALMIYQGTWSDAQDSQVAAFSKRFPCIKVQRYTADTGTRRERFLSETRAKQYIDDIVQDTDPGSLNEQAAQGLLMNYTITNDKDYADAVKLKGYWYPLRIGIAGTAWNTNLVTPDQAKGLDSWQGAIDPQWTGKAGLVDPSGGGADFLPYYAWWKLYGESFFQKVGALKPRVFQLNALGAALASGDISVVLGTSETPLTTLWLQGAPIQWALPEPGVGPVTGQAIAAHAPHPDAAKLYQEYAFTEEGYAAWQTLGGPPARIGYKDQRKVAAQPWYKYPTHFFQYDPADVTRSKAPVLALFNKWIAGAH